MKEKKKMVGEGPMPQKSWGDWLIWALSPYRVVLFLCNVAILLGVAFATWLGVWWAGVLYGLVFLWFLERARE